MVTSSNAGLLFPANATLLPATGHGWFFGFWFWVPDYFSQGNQNEVLGGKGTTVLGTGGSDTSIYINQGNITDPLKVNVSVKNGGSALYAIASQPAGQVVQRGKSYLLIFGQTGTTPFVSLADTDGNIISNTAGSTTSMAGAFSFLTGVGAAVGVSGNQRGFSGAIQAVFMCWGAFPNAAGVPDAATLISLATGLTTPYDVVNSGLSDNPTYRYFAGLKGPGDLTADSRGAIAGAMTTQGASVTPFIGNPIRPQAWLSLTELGDGYVWGLVAGAATATVKFSGSYAVTGSSAPVIQARLVRVDSGIAVAGFDWQTLSAPSVAGGAFSGYFANVPAGVGFRREVRFANGSAAAFASKERHGVGIVLVLNAQSQAAMLISPNGSGSGSGTGGITPTETDNTWLTYLGVDVFLQGSSVQSLSDTTPTAPNQTNGPIGDVTVLRRVQGIVSGLWGNGILALANTLISLTGYPVMICNGTKSGHAPQDFYSDRYTATQAGPITGFAPNGVTTAFTFNLDSPGAVGWPLAGVGGYGPTTTFNNAINPTIKAGTLAITVGAATVTDDGAGNLTGTNVSSGTVNYTTGACTLNYSAAPSAATPSASWTFIDDTAAGSEVPKSPLNGYTTWGVLGQNHQGIISDLYLKLGDNVVSAVVFPWWTTLVTYTPYTGTASYSTSLAALTAQWDAIKYAHKRASQCASAIFFMGPAARECPSSGATEQSDRSKYGAHRVMTRAYVGSNADCRLLAETYNLPIASNSGPHETPGGYQQMGQVYAYALASPWASVTAEGPYLTSAVVNGPRTVITLTFAFSDPLASALSAVDGVTTTGITGFEIGSDASSQNTAFTNRSLFDGAVPFTVAIASATTVTITITSGAWATNISLSYAAGNPIFTGTANGAADAVLLGKLLCDNSGKYTLPSGGAPAGNSVRPILNMLIQ